MLVNAKKILIKAKKNKYAVPHFNVSNLETIRYVLEEGNRLKSPLILGVSQSAAEYAGGYEVFYKITETLIKNLKIKVPVALHLDHGQSFEECKKAIKAGFTSVMIDASKYDLKKNIKETKKVVNFAKKYNVSVEAEVGHIGGKEDTVKSSILYAEVDDCIKLTDETNIDFFAPALGSVHGFYKGKPKIDYKRMKEINTKVKAPLVLHGGSGLSNSIIKKSIESGISKINVDTELRVAWSTGVKEFLKENPEEYDVRKIIKSGEKKLKEKVKRKIVLFGSKNRA